MRLLLVTLWLVFQPAIGAAQTEAIQEALRAGAYADAEVMARAALAAAESAPRRGELDFAHVLDAVVAAATANGRAADPATLAMARRSLEIKERLRVAPAERAGTWHLLGRIDEIRGEFSTALALHQRALSARQSAAADSSVVADSLDAVARALLGLERWADAEKTIGRALTVRTAESERAPLALARTLELAARVKREVGQYRDAAGDLDRALELWNRFAPTHPDKASTLDVRGYVAFLLGDIAGSRRFWLEARDLTAAQLQPQHPDRARSARSLAVTEAALGDLRRARELREEGLAIAERTMAPCDPEMAFQFNDVAISLQYDGEYAAADRMFRRELDTIRRCHGLNHSAAATAVYNQFALAREVGRYADAERLGQLAIDLWSRALGPSHPFVAFGLNDLADFFASRGNWRRAEVLFTRALRIRRKALGAGHPDVASTLTGLARTRAQAGDSAGAQKLLAEAITMLERAPARDADYLPAALALRGALETRTGQYTAARDTLLAALDIRERSLGAHHPLVASTRADLAAADLALGAHDRAFRSALSAERDASELLRFSVRYMPEQRAMEYATARPRGLDVALSVVAAHPEDSGTLAADALDAVIRSRGIVLDELAARARTLAHADPALTPLTAAVADARRRFSGMVLRSLGVEAQEPAVLERLRRQKEEAEAALAVESGALGHEVTRSGAGFADVRRTLPHGTALISFVRYSRSIQVTGASRNADRTPSYIAFVTPPDSGRVVVVPLGSAEIIERQVVAWRRQVGPGAALANGGSRAATQRYRQVGLRLRQQIWDPLVVHLAGAERVFVVPDGALHLVSLAALPTASDTYLVEDGPTLHYLATERDLLEAADVPFSQGLLLIGGAVYGAPPAQTAPADTSANCAPAGPPRFDYLPGSRAEVDAIAALWSSAAARTGTRGEDFKVLSGSNARKSAVVSSAPGRRILHLATHAFFLRNCGAIGSRSLRAVGGVVPRTPVRRDDNPLLLSGLALAGANAVAARGRDNGLLTAEEVSTLNLQGTEWAVLSACETGVGDTPSGEGVLGLRRAFQVAGVRTIILSLWSVEDRATRDWMTALYRARLLDGQDTAQAVRTASLTLLKARRARGLSTHPFYWAAFAAAGDWR